MNSASNGAKLVAIKDELQKVRDEAPGQKKLADKVIEKFDKVAKKALSPAAFKTADQLLPLAATFTDELKKAGFMKVRVISYGAKISAGYFGCGGGPGGVTLIVPPSKPGQKERQVSAKDKDFPNLVKIWI